MAEDSGAESRAVNEMTTKGRTTRLILRAAEALSAGYCVTIVAFTKPVAVLICKRICALAKHYGIPCRNVVGGDPEGPWVRARAMDETVPVPTPTAKVLFDHRCGFERAQVVPERVRSVLA